MPLQQLQPQLTWANIVMSIGTAAVLAGAGWTLFQTQFGYIEKDKENIRQELRMRTAEVNARFDKIEAELLTRRDQFIDQRDFGQYEKRIDSILKIEHDQLNILEQTRPTAGELQGVAKSTSEQIQRILDRLDKIDKK